MKNDLKIALKRVENALAKSKTEVALPVKLKMSALMLGLRSRRKKFGMLVILGWKNKWNAYADTPDVSQDLFRRQHVNIMKIVPRAQQPGNKPRIKPLPRRGDIVKTINFDGAILIDDRGNVLHSGTMIEGLRPRATAATLSPRRATDLSSQFGFKRKVHMRHITAITSSYTFKGTTVFTISEETDDFHIFEHGRIVYSTVRGEMK